MTRVAQLCGAARQLCKWEQWTRLSSHSKLQPAALQSRRFQHDDSDVGRPGDDFPLQTIPAEQTEPPPAPAPPIMQKPTLLVDTMKMMKQYEERGLSRGQAEALTRYMTELILNQHARNIEAFVSKAHMDRTLVELKSNQRHHKQELLVAHQVHENRVVKEAERLETALDKFKIDVKHEVDKLTASQKLDLNLERGRMRDELQTLHDKLGTHVSGLERQIQQVTTDQEKHKNENFRFFIGSMIALLGSGAAIVRLVFFDMSKPSPSHPPPPPPQPQEAAEPKLTGGSASPVELAL